MLRKGTEHIAISLYYKRITCIRPDLIIDDVHHLSMSIYASIYLYRVYSFVTFES